MGSYTHQSIAIFESLRTTEIFPREGDLERTKCHLTSETSEPSEIRIQTGSVAHLDFFSLVGRFFGGDAAPLPPRLGCLQKAPRTGFKRFFCNEACRALHQHTGTQSRSNSLCASPGGLARALSVGWEVRLQVADIGNRDAGPRWRSRGRDQLIQQLLATNEGWQRPPCDHGSHVGLGDDEIQNALLAKIATFGLPGKAV